MSQIIQDLGDFNLEEIDDYLLAPEMQDYSNNDNHTRVSSDGNYYHSEYNAVLRNDEIIYEPSSVSSDTTSTVVSLSSDTTSTAVLPIANAASAVSSPIKQLLRGRIKDKMQAEGREETQLFFVQASQDNQLTPEEERKKLEKQLRNKEAARRSRQKKKEDEDKLIMDNEFLTATNEKLKQEVTYYKLVNEKYEKFFSNHQCTIYHQQENGDKMSVATGGNEVCNDDDISSCIDQLDIYDATPLPFSQGSESQRLSAIVSFLQGDDQIVTSGAAYADNRFFNNNAGYSIDIQENMLPGDLFDELTTGTGAFAGTLLAGSEDVGSQAETFNTESTTTDQLMPQEMSPITDMGTWTNNSSVPSMKKSMPKLSVWSTVEASQSEADEARNLVQGLSPPPEKKLRRE